MAILDKQNITYCGKEAQGILAKGIYDLDIRATGVKLMDGVKGKQKIYTGETGDAWQEYTCAFTSTGAASLAESFIEPVRIKVNQEECFDVYDGTFLAEQTEATMRGQVPQTFAEWYFDRLQKKMKKEYQEIFWKGDTAWSGETKKYLKVTDGIEKRLKNSEHAQKLTGSAITVANVLSQVEAAILAAITYAAKEEVPTDDYKVLLNKADYDLLVMALGKMTVNDGNFTQTVWSNYGKKGDIITIYGFEIHAAEISKNTIIVGPTGNLVLGYDTQDSQIEYRIIDMRETTGENKFRVLALSNIAVGLILDELFVISKP